MGIYQLSIQNLRRNKLRNISAIFRISLGVLILLVLVGSGLGISSFFQDTSSINGNVFSENPSKENVTTIISEVTGFINSAFGINVDNSKVLSTIKNYLPSLVYILDAIASLSFLIGVLDVLNTMNLNLSERRREIGILKSLGFSKNQIMLSISFEASFFGLFGSIVGIILGSIVLILLSSFLGLHSGTLLPPRLIIGIIFLTTVLALILGAIPGWFTSRLEIGETMKYE
ncbi:MAG: ABC transporter permease [Methanobacterium sp.]